MFNWLFGDLRNEMSRVAMAFAKAEEKLSAVIGPTKDFLAARDAAEAEIIARREKLRETGIGINKRFDAAEEHHKGHGVRLERIETKLDEILRLIREPYPDLCLPPDTVRIDTGDGGGDPDSGNARDHGDDPDDDGYDDNAAAAAVR